MRVLVWQKSLFCCKYKDKYIDHFFMITELFKSQSDALFERLVSIRRHIHSNPELSFEEHNT
ncbi:MAG TPA: hypothetical protein PLS00_17035, partial [Niabella sp.]|nr:hypothetical protein [Niabella sp.]